MPPRNRSEPAFPSAEIDAGPPRAAASTAPGSSIRVVSEVTGLPMDTLRAWERRYGFPKPVRREGSNRRLYNAEDIERLGWVAHALQHGYRPMDVIEKPLTEIRALVGRASQKAGKSVPPPPEVAGRSVTGVSSILELLARDEVSSVQAELRLAAAALGPRRFVTDLAHPLAIAVGEAWADGALAIRQEHVMTECLTTQLRLLLGAHQDITGGPVVLLATLPSEPHTLGLQMVAVYLAVGGAKPYLLGANTPNREIVEAAQAFEASAVGVTVTPSADLPACRRALRQIGSELPRQVVLWVGGAGARHIELRGGRARRLDDWASIDAAIAEIRLGTRAS